MKKLLLVLVLVTVALSGCMEKSQSGPDKSVGDLKTLSIKSAENLSSYSLKSSVTQTLLLNAPGANATAENATTIKESADTEASVDLLGFKAKASGSTKNTVKLPGQAENSSSTNANVYQIGNSTYVKDETGNWTHLKDPRPAEAIWGEGNNNQVKAMVLMINQSQVEAIGSESIDGEDAYKLDVVTGSADYDNLYNIAFSIAAKFAQYPMLMPSINRTELNETGSMKKTVWISKKTYLPVKYQSIMSFRMTPEIVGGLDPNTGQMKMFNQSMLLGAILVSIETNDLYYGFNKSVDMAMPDEALRAEPISPTQIQAASQV
jgi:outer membrane lipoprotein-sorting protein